MAATMEPAAPRAGAGAPAWCNDELSRTAWSIGAEVAALHADDVDRQARVPSEAIEAMREAGLFASLVPTELGGAGATVGSAATAIRAIAVHCSAAALVLAMHQIEVWFLVRHGHTDGLRELLRKVATDGVLIANGNSEVGLGGDVSRSYCAVETAGGRARLTKDVLAMSYVDAADAILLIARRSPDAEENDQVMIAAGPGSFTWEQTSEWNTMGLRGTCSVGVRVEMDERDDMVFPTPWGTIGAECIGGSTIFLNSVWLGIAEAAAARAHAYVRADARKRIGTTPASAPLLAELTVSLGEARAVMESAVRNYEAAVIDGTMEAASLLLAVRNLKLSETMLAIDVVTKASRICGLAGYQLDSPWAMDRNIRDILGAPLMVNNFRAAMENQRLLLAMKQI